MLRILYSSFISKTELFYRYKFGLAYNETRIQNCIIELPKDFIALKDKSKEPLLIWVNPNLKLNSNFFIHEQKKLTVRNSELLLEEDLFKIKDKNSNGFKLLAVKHYYNKDGRDREIYISKEFLNNKLIRCDTLVNNPFPCK